MHLVAIVCVLFLMKSEALLRRSLLLVWSRLDVAACLTFGADCVCFFYEIRGTGLQVVRTALKGSELSDVGDETLQRAAAQTEINK